MNQSKFVIKWGKYCLDLSQRTYIMGILNITPDSFSDGGKYQEIDKAIEHGIQMVAQGADIIDIGGESTRPGSIRCSVKEELDRVIPVIRELSTQIDIPISIDTYKSDVAQKALQEGAQMVNDISALRFDPKMALVVAEYNVPLVLMHIQGTPQDMQKNPQYKSLIPEIIAQLNHSIKRAQKFGIKREMIIIDPGIGFGKTLQHNLEILSMLKEFKRLNAPILIGTSRKSLIGQVLGVPVKERLEGTAATVAISIFNGANIIRVHDVLAMKRVAQMTDAIIRA